MKTIAKTFAIATFAVMLAGTTVTLAASPAEAGAKSTNSSSSTNTTNTTNTSSTKGSTKRSTKRGTKGGTKGVSTLDLGSSR